MIVDFSDVVRRTMALRKRLQAANASGDPTQIIRAEMEVFASGLESIIVCFEGVHAALVEIEQRLKHLEERDRAANLPKH